MKAFLRQEYIASCEKRGREIDGVSDNAVSRFVADYERTEAAKADLQKLEHLHRKGTSALLALSSYGSLVLGPTTGPGRRRRVRAAETSK
jgi:hypothetical protein